MDGCMGWILEWIVHGYMSRCVIGGCMDMDRWTDRPTADRRIVGEQISKGSTEKGQSAQLRAGEHVSLLILEQNQQRM